MKAVLQRVLKANVSIDSKIVSEIDRGWLVLLGISNKDTVTDVEYLVDKTLGLRAFPDDQDRMNLSIEQIQREILVVSQFTLYGDCRKGRRPSFSDAAAPELANFLYEEYIRLLRLKDAKVKTGVFQAMMEVSLINDGPVTLLLDSEKK